MSFPGVCCSSNTGSLTLPSWFCCAQPSLGSYPYFSTYFIISKALNKSRPGPSGHLSSNLITLKADSFEPAFETFALGLAYCTKAPALCKCFGDQSTVLSPSNHLNWVLYYRITEPLLQPPEAGMVGLKDELSCRPCCCPFHV
jgi:hypothetical protein